MSVWDRNPIHTLMKSSAAAGCECLPAGTLPTTGMKRRGGGRKGDVALRVTCSTPLHLFSVKQGKLPHSLWRVEVHRAPHVPGAVMRSSVAVTRDKLSRRPRCCLVYAQSCLISTTGNSLPTGRQGKMSSFTQLAVGSSRALLPPGPLKFV